jgi:hypothetical protein
MLRRTYNQLYLFLTGRNLKNCLKELKEEVPTIFEASRDKFKGSIPQ